MEHSLPSAHPGEHHSTTPTSQSAEPAHHHPASSQEDIMRERKEKLINFFKNKYTWISYILLALLVWFAIWIRTLNTPGLRDVTTGGWTLGPDLDPFLFLRWTKEIVATGTLSAWDTMRYVPLGYQTSGELVLFSYMIAFFHKIAVFFGSTSIEQSAAIFPAVMFGFTVIAFFLMVRKMFLGFISEAKADIIAIISSLFLIIIPSLLPRTIAGIPEKESVGFLFMFLTYYFFLSSWKSKNKWVGYLQAILAGVTTALMSLVWGGSIYLFITLGVTVLFSFILGQVDTQRWIRYSLWILCSLVLTLSFTSRYTLMGYISSLSIGIFIVAWGVITMDKIIRIPSIEKYFNFKFLANVSKEVRSLFIAIVIGLLAILVLPSFGPSFIVGMVKDIQSHLVTPVTDRLGVTVAENRQPFFQEWAYSFGPIVKGIPIFFWLFFVGSIYLFWSMMGMMIKRERAILTGSYVIFLICIIFSRYKPDSVLNGTNSLSFFVYFLGFASLAGAMGFYHWHYNKRGDAHRLKSIDSGIILLFILFFLSIISARGAVRLIMVLVPSSAIIVSFLVVMVASGYIQQQERSSKLIMGIIAAILILSLAYSGNAFYQETKNTAKAYVPSAYTQQWQYAMQWVRENTPKNAVFGHWWDYGYWLQSIGERATVLDGGNAISYWDYLMGRYGLTNRNLTESLEFFYAHNTTHFLIDSTDIGKYSAFSSIGSDLNYDRASWMPIFLRDSRQTQETKNTTLTIFTGGTSLDGDIFYQQNGTRVFIPGGKGGIGGIILEENRSGALVKPPLGVYVDQQGQQYRVPLRYAYKDGKLINFKEGIEAGVVIFPRLIQGQGGYSIDPEGTMIYLSNKTVQGQLARLYLYNEDNGYFRLVHSEDDFLVKQLKISNVTNSDFVFYDAIHGPIKIWEISYPPNMKVNPVYVQRNYPDVRLTQA